VNRRRYILQRAEADGRGCRKDREGRKDREEGDCPEKDRPVAEGSFPMRSIVGIALIIVPVAALGAAIAFVSATSAQAPPVPGLTRMADGRPNLNGIWQANNSANWDIQAHQARQGPVVALGAAFSAPGGFGIVQGNDIPYRPEALARKRENAAHWMTADPEIKCYLPGIPRATYMPFPFQIVQSSGLTDILIAYEFASASRIIRMTAKEESPSDTWMGWSRGHWEKDTLVVDVTSFNDQTWFDRAGNYHSDALHVVERYTPITRDALRYEATIEDPKVFTRPWQISMPLYRRLEDKAQLVEFKCVEFVEELLYGQLRRHPVDE
jgi:hypothetical protein